MLHTRTLLLSLFFALGSLSMMLYTACTKDRCRDINCLNGGTCNDGLCECPPGWAGPNCEIDACSTLACANGGTCYEGSCICPVGYEGTQCETESRTKFIGIWFVTEDGTSGNPSQYIASVQPDAVVNTVHVLNLHNSFVSPVVATIVRDTLTIPLQTVNNFTVEGRGTIQDDPNSGNSGRMTLRYRVKDQNGNTDDFGLDTGAPSIWNR